jgi:hypothetical protein
VFVQLVLAIWELALVLPQADQGLIAMALPSPVSVLIMGLAIVMIFAILLRLRHVLASRELLMAVYAILTQYWPAASRLILASSMTLAMRLAIAHPLRILALLVMPQRLSTFANRIIIIVRTMKLAILARRLLALARNFQSSIGSVRLADFASAIPISLARLIPIVLLLLAT